MKPIERMYKHCGKDHAHKCRDCDNLVSRTQGRKWYKCLIYGDSRCVSTDWRINQTACGHFGKPLRRDERQIVNLYKDRREPDNTPCDGQVGLFEATATEGGE